MHTTGSTSSTRTARQRIGWVIAALSAVALLGLGLANPAQAAPTVSVGPKTHSIPPVHYTSARQVLGAKKGGK